MPNIETLHVAKIETRRARTSKAAVIEHREAPQVTAVDHRAGDRPSSGQHRHGIHRRQRRQCGQRRQRQQCQCHRRQRRQCGKRQQYGLHLHSCQCRFKGRRRSRSLQHGGHRQRQRLQRPWRHQRAQRRITARAPAKRAPMTSSLTLDHRSDHRPRPHQRPRPQRAHPAQPRPSPPHPPRTHPPRPPPSRTLIASPSPRSLQWIHIGITGQRR